MTVLFKIKSKKTGLYSKGGTSVSWSKNGKVWKTRSHLNLHINGLDRYGRNAYREHDAEVIELVIVEENVSSTPIDIWITAAAERKNKRELDAKERVDAWRRQSELAELERLQRKYNDVPR